MNSRIKLLIGIVLATLGVGGIYFSSIFSKKPAETALPNPMAPVTKPFSLKWGGPKNISMLPIIAEAQGYFAKYQVAANYIDIQTGKKAMDALRTGDLDLGVLVDSNIAFAGYEGADDLRIIACIMTKRDDSLLVSTNGFHKGTDLEQQTIGVTLGTTTHAYLIEWLKANGLKPSSVKLQNMPPPAIQAALLNGSLKAGALWQPFRYNVLAAKPGAFLDLKEPTIYTSYVLLVSSKRFLEVPGSSVAISNFVRGLLDAQSFTTKNKEESQKIIAERLGLPFEVTQIIWREYDLNVFLDSRPLKLLQQEGRWIRETIPEHATKELPQYDPFFHPDILRGLDSGLVKEL